MVFRQLRECVYCKNKKRTSVKKAVFTCRSCRGFIRRITSQVKGNENFPKDSLDVKDISILFCLKEQEEGLIARGISEKIELPLSSTYKRISALGEGGFIEKNDSFCKITPRTKRQLLNLKGWDLDWLFMRTKKNKGRALRFHTLQGKFVVESPPANYGIYLNKYIKVPVGRNKDLTGFQLEIGSCIIVFYSPTSISVTFPNILVDSLNTHRIAEGYSKLGYAIDSLVYKLESLFPGLKIDSFCPFHLDNQHIAIRDSVYAKRYFERNGGYLNENNIITDKSHGHFELEAVNPLTAGEDIEECLRREENA